MEEKPNSAAYFLVMTATPVQELYVSLYGDLDLSAAIGEPAGKKPIQTVHRYDSNRLKFGNFTKLKS
jgi:ATP-dependent DNA helicase RecG